MADVQDPNDVKRLYKKATLLCHPDRIQASGDPEKIYIANRCFAALTEAFTLFKVSIVRLLMGVYRKRLVYSEGRMCSILLMMYMLLFVIFNKDKHSYYIK